MSQANNIYIGVYIADLQMPWVRSLKEKRSLIRPVTEKLKLRYPVSVARLDGLNEHVWERIGATAISHDPKWLDDVLNKVHSFVSANGDYRVGSWDISIDVWDVEDSVSY